MKQKTSVLLTLASLILTLFLSFNLKTSYAVAEDKVTICHATDSASNPFERIVTSPNAIGGHFDNPGNPKAGHEGDLLFTGEVECPGPIPTFVPTPTNIPFPECNEDYCPIATPTTQPTPTSTGGAQIVGNIDLPCLFGCPTQTPTPTTQQPTVTPTPTSQPSSNTGGGSGDGGSSGSSSSSSSPSTGGTVLGTATTLAATGTFTDTLFNAIAAVGVLAMGLATVQYGKEKGK